MVSGNHIPDLSGDAVFVASIFRGRDEKRREKIPDPRHHKCECCKFSTVRLFVDRS